MVAAIDVIRQVPRNVSTAANVTPEDLVAQAQLRAKIRITTRAMWVDGVRAGCGLE